MVESKQIEIFCGTGGVGKTTLATARAFYLAKQSKKILLMTIDPSKRLKQILNLSDDDQGEIKNVLLSAFENESGESLKSFDALLMSPQSTMRRMIQQSGVVKASENRILSILSQPYGGMNEILSIIELSYHLKSKKYDTIILDTPPGQHFVDFLENSIKIENFFQQKYVEIFESISKKVIHSSSGEFIFSPLNRLFKATLSKLLKYLEKVTGQSFLSEFVETVNTIYQIREPFIETFQFHKNYLQNLNLTHWFLVTATDQDKTDEMIHLRKQTSDFTKQKGILLINRTIESSINLDELQSSPFPLEKKHVETFLQKEQKIIHDGQKFFFTIMKFPDIIGNTSQHQIEALAHYFKK